MTFVNEKKKWLGPSLLIWALNHQKKIQDGHNLYLHVKVHNLGKMAQRTAHQLTRVLSEKHHYPPLGLDPSRLESTCTGAREPSGSWSSQLGLGRSGRGTDELWLSLTPSRLSWRIRRLTGTLAGMAKNTHCTNFPAFIPKGSRGTFKSNILQFPTP